MNFLCSSENLSSLFQEKDEDIDVSPDTGEPISEAPKFGVKEKAFDTLIEDEEEEKMEEQENDEEIKLIEQSYAAGIVMEK